MSTEGYTIDLRKLMDVVVARNQAKDLCSLITEVIANMQPTQKFAFWQELKMHIGEPLTTLNCFRCNKWPCQCADGVCLLNADANLVADQLKQLGGVDLVLTDPPYGQAYVSNRLVSGKAEPVRNDQSLNELATVWRKMLPLLKDMSHWFVFGSAKPRLMAEQIRFLHPKQILIWDKGNGTAGDLKKCFGCCHELIYFGSNGNACLKFRGRTIIKHKPIYNRFHPTQKPEGLCMQLIEVASKSGDLVLDPFCGSGSTLIAAKRIGRRAIGIECEQKYCQVAAERLAKCNVKSWEVKLNP